jgi:serine-aspartate repeat-containing protein C/D/E
MKNKIALIVASLAVMTAMIGTVNADMGITADPAHITINYGADGTQNAIVETPAGIFTMDVYIVKITSPQGATIWEAASDGLGGYDLNTVRDPKDYFTISQGTHFVNDSNNTLIQIIPVKYTNDKPTTAAGDYQILYTAVWCTGTYPFTCTRQSFDGGEMTAEAHVTAISDGLSITADSGSISGMKFNDVNGNGTQDKGETGLAGWTITLTKPDASVITTTTAADGTYSFPNLADGTYTVAETMQDGWIQTMPSTGTYAVTITSGAVITGQDFGNFKLGGIHGMKFNDLNGDGIKDTSEPGLPDWTIMLTKPDGSVIATTTTAADGTYNFTNLAAGTYVVGETQQTGWEQTYPMPPGTHTVDIVSGSEVMDKDFGNFKLNNFKPGTISGTKFDDVNVNGLQDKGEPGLEGWTITLTNQTGNIVTTTTAADGTYSFPNLAAGTYVVGETQQTGWIQTAPAPIPPGTYTVTLAEGEDAINKNFGNFKLGTISGRTFNDLNGDGMHKGDPGLGDWTITLTKPDGSFITTMTAADGTYSFPNLAAGTYVVGETQQTGWVQTAPGPIPPGAYTVTLAEGEDAINKDFGNFKLGEIHGMKWEDLNANGKKDPKEKGLAGWEININGTDTITGERVNITTKTDAKGNYSFMNLTAGTYVISETSKCKSNDDDTKDDHNEKDHEHNSDNNVKDNGHNNDYNVKDNGHNNDNNKGNNDNNKGNNDKSKVCWIQTAPATGNYTVTITSGSNITGLDFGNVMKKEEEK